MTLKIFRHARILVPASLDPRKDKTPEVDNEKVSFKSLAKKSVGGVFALSGTTFVSATVLALAASPLELTSVLLGSLVGMVVSAGPVLSSHLDHTGAYIPFKKNHAQSEPVAPVYFEPYRNWDEVFVNYTDRLIDKHIECETPVGFVTVATQNSADMYRIRQEQLKGNSNISWSGIYGEISEYDKEIFFRTADEKESVLFTETKQ